MDQGIENLLLVALGLVFVGAVGLWGLARALALLTSVSITSFAKQGAWQATVQQYAVFVKRLADEFFGSGAAIGRGVCVQHTLITFLPPTYRPTQGHSGTHSAVRDSHRSGRHLARFVAFQARQGCVQGSAEGIDAAQARRLVVEATSLLIRCQA